LLLGRWSPCRHEEPHDGGAKQGYRRHTQKCCRVAKIRGDQAKDCSAEGSTDSGRSSNDALSQIEPTAAVRNVGSDQCREHADYRSADPIKQLKADKKQWICDQGKQQRTDRQSPERDED